MRRGAVTSCQGAPTPALTEYVAKVIIEQLTGHATLSIAVPARRSTQMHIPESIHKVAGARRRWYRRATADVMSGFIRE